MKKFIIQKIIVLKSKHGVYDVNETNNNNNMALNTKKILNIYNWNNNNFIALTSCCKTQLNSYIPSFVTSITSLGANSVPNVVIFKFTKEFLLMTWSFSNWTSFLSKKPT